jgi:hypothetical protein
MIFTKIFTNSYIDKEKAYTNILIALTTSSIQKKRNLLKKSHKKQQNPFFALKHVELEELLLFEAVEESDD